MAQTNAGLHAVLKLPFVYSLFETFVGALAGRAKVIREYVRAERGHHILDIGCGPGDVVQFLPEGVQYHGFDESAAYIESAKKRFGDRATFVCARVEDDTLPPEGKFDIVLALGVLHHLDDPEAVKLFRTAWAALKPGGRLITLDGCYLPGQSRLARWFLSKDRGKNIRTQEEYVRLARAVFPNPEAAIRHDLFRIPYTNLVLECMRP